MCSDTALGENKKEQKPYAELNVPSKKKKNM
jgi:hypothetical protein